jgi:2-dehydropantoate 2-reductase
MRFVVLGAGAIGGVIGAGLHRAGHEVVLVARGRTLDALRSNGLRVQTPDEDLVLPIETFGSPAEAGVTQDDVVILATKSQDTVAALDALAACDVDVPVACAQNGVANERMALRRFARVYGVFVWLPAQHLETGVVQVYSAPVPGVLDVGRYPHGVDETAEALASAFTSAGCISETSSDIMRLKRAKLLGNLGNAIEVIVGDDDAEMERLHGAAVAEALACFAAAGLDHTPEAEMRARGARMSPPREVHGIGHEGGSSWQSLMRDSGSIEADFLNGEIALLGRLHGLPTPVNTAVQRLANHMARNRLAPGSLANVELQRRT